MSQSQNSIQRSAQSMRSDDLVMTTPSGRHKAKGRLSLVLSTRQSLITQITGDLNAGTQGSLAICFGMRNHLSLSPAILIHKNIIRVVEYSIRDLGDPSKPRQWWVMTTYRCLLITSYLTSSLRLITTSKSPLTLPFLGVVPLLTTGKTVYHGKNWLGIFDTQDSTVEKKSHKKLYSNSGHSIVLAYKLFALQFSGLACECSHQWHMADSWSTLQKLRRLIWA